jgi:hypothetical protein
MIPTRLPWRQRARPSATLHEIQVRSPFFRKKSELVVSIVQNEAWRVKGKFVIANPESALMISKVAKKFNAENAKIAELLLFSEGTNCQTSDSSTRRRWRSGLRSE